MNQLKRPLNEPEFLTLEKLQLLASEAATSSVAVFF